MEKPSNPSESSEEIARVEAWLGRPATSVNASDLIDAYGMAYMQRTAGADIWLRTFFGQMGQETIDVECEVVEPKRLER